MAQSITVDLTPDGRRIFQRPTLYFSQGEVGTSFTINTKSRFGLTVPNGATAKIQATKPSGLGFSVTGTVTGQSVAFTTAEGMTDEAGHFPADLLITASGITIETANFNMVVEETPHHTGVIDGQAEEVVPYMTQLVERVEDAADSIHDLNVSATTLPADSDATADYDGDTNTIEFGIPKGEDGNLITTSDTGSDGNIVITKS